MTGNRSRCGIARGEHVCGDEICVGSSVAGREDCKLGFQHSCSKNVNENSDWPASLVCELADGGPGADELVLWPEEDRTQSCDTHFANLLTTLRDAFRVCTDSGDASGDRIGCSTEQNYSQAA